MSLAASVAAEQLAPGDSVEFAGLLEAYDAALASENADAVASLYVRGKGLTVRQMVGGLRETFAAYEELQAESEMRLWGASGDAALLRVHHRLTGRPRGGAQTVEFIADEVSDHLLRREGGSWRFSGQSWPITSPEAELRRMVGAKAGAAGPRVVDVVLVLRAGSWQAVRALEWRGRVSAAAPVGLEQRVQAAAASASDLYARRQAGTLHLLTQIEAQGYVPLNSVWLPEEERGDEELALRRLLDQVETDFGNAQRHEELARRLETADLAGLALVAWEKAAGLEATPAREAAVRRLRAALGGPAGAGAAVMAAAAGGPVGRMPAPDSRSQVARAKPPNVLVSQPFLLRLAPGEPRASEILAILETLHRQVTQSFGIPMQQVEVSVFATREDFNAFRRWRGETEVPLWSGGVSGVDGILTYSRPGVERSIAHEYAHEAIKQFAGGAVVPVWLDEGVAAIVEGLAEGWEEELRRLHGAGRLVSIGELSGPWSALPAELAAGAYAESRSLAGYLLSTAGREGLLAILTELRRGANFDQAFQKVLGVDMAGFQRQWLVATFGPVGAR
ncbi:MAG: peptidase MA family metallohydrolase [Armatimonadota bacterium]